MTGTATAPDTVSAYDPTTGRFYLSNDPATGTAQITLMYGNPGALMYGNPGAQPLVGDWDGDGKDNIGVRMATPSTCAPPPSTNPAKPPPPSPTATPTTSR